jgi:hypothetical protein
MTYTEQVITNSVVQFYPITYPIIDTASWNIAEDKGVIHNQYFHDTVVALVNSIPSGRIMILVQRIAHGNILHKMLHGSFWISGKDDSTARYEWELQLDEVNKNVQDCGIGEIAIIHCYKSGGFGFEDRFCWSGCFCASPYQCCWW